MSKFVALLFFYTLLHTGISLKCYQCTGVPYNCQETVAQCYINQTTCMSQSHSLVVNGTLQEWTTKGCSQGLVCNETSYADMGANKKYVSTYCCSSDLCNTGTYYARVPVASLHCFNCSGSNESCALQNLTVIQCAGMQDRCMTITTASVKGGLRTDTTLKGCGTGNLCDRVLEYNAGNARLYTATSCCGKTKCNNGTTRVSVKDNLNGLQCYACNETGKGECKVVNTTVQCSGSMTYCMDAVGFPRGNTLMRGCCSKDVCLGLSVSLLVQASQKFYCCSGNLCNNGDVESYFRSSSCRVEISRYALGLLILSFTCLLRALL
ncbi:urokinase plasminogen activator surface receptor-like [Bombina bombina]|uniref:urokinase plasminogen activator surface receptor-like n=1 Tax=Bombina bombina TaxID=8345 RepID=UPI00235A73A6|nr:urokinase plasminogen activator surface receptor-like [Bombina bombina]